MHIAVLGPLAVQRGGGAPDGDPDDGPGTGTIDVGGAKPRALLALLALHAGRPVAPDRIVDLLWPGRPPAAATASLQTYVAKLRQLLEPGRRARAAATVLVTASTGYALRLPADAIDAARFRSTVDRVHRSLPRPGAGILRIPPGLHADRLPGMRADLDAALSLWRGTPYHDLPADDAVVAERAGLAELRVVAVEDLALLRMGLGEDAAVAGDLQPVLADHPVRESLWALAVLALARAGRQADALTAARRIRGTLADELGIDPGPTLQQLEQAVLRQDPALRWRPEPPVVAGAVTPAEPPVTPDTPAPHDAAPLRASASGEGPAPTDPRTGRPGTAERVDRSPLVGRQAELAALTGLLERSAGGRPGAALLIGEAGIGKSRLIAEAAERAEATGMTVLAATCSADTGAPPLWPWTRILAQLADARPDPDDDGAPGFDPVRTLAAGLAVPSAVDPLAAEGTRFHWWEAVTARLRAAAAAGPLLVVVDDAHWADASTLALLAHVVDRLQDARVAIVVARRPVVDPPAPLAALGEVLARRDAVRLELAGLAPDDVRTLLAAASGDPAPGGVDPDLDARARQVWARTDGNAFFVTELIRWGTGDHRAADEIPSGVSDVVLSRLARLPGPARETLLAAAVIGREFDALLLSAATGAEVDEVVDALDHAIAAGLIGERDAARYAFTHALVRDALVSSQPPRRRARRHADVAAALDRGVTLDPGRAAAEAVRHWFAAGPLHAARAWRAAVTAADNAVALRAWDEATALLAEAARAAAADPAATDEQRYDIQMRLADACRWRADQDGLDAALLAAVALADRMGDPTRSARAAIGTVEAAVWLPREYGTVNRPIVEALRRLLRQLPSQDGELGCRVMLALASELYYADAPQERAALVEQGLAIARRLDRPDLLVWAMTAAYQATWLPATAEQRHGLAR